VPVPWSFLDGVTTADIAFRASGGSLEELFASAVDAVVASMVSEPRAILPRDQRLVSLRAESVEMLLYELLEAVIFHKDAEGLLLRVAVVEVHRERGEWSLTATLRGERIDLQRHQRASDVKAVTLQGYAVWQAGGSWTADVVLDV
jgi:SHS2 domain-containing protein